MLTNRVAIVTGGGQGIGRAICLRLANDAVRVAVTDRDLATAEEAAKLIREEDGAKHFLWNWILPTLMPSRTASLPHVKSGAAASMPSSTTLVGTRSNRSSAVSRRLGTSVPLMVDQGGGRIVSKASGEAVYAGCKAGIIGFSKTIAREMARHKINVVWFAPAAPALRSSKRSPAECRACGSSRRW